MEATLDTVAAPNAYVRATETVKYLRAQLPEALQNPKVAIVCGSGLGGLADTIEPEPKVELPYGAIPHFPKSTGMLGNLQWMRGTDERGSPRSCWKVCLWSDWASEDACGASCGTGTVSHVTL